MVFVVSLPRSRACLVCFQCQDYCLSRLVVYPGFIFPTSISSLDCFVHWPPLSPNIVKGVDLVLIFKRDSIILKKKVLRLSFLAYQIYFLSIHFPNNSSIGDVYNSWPLSIGLSILYEEAWDLNGF